MSEWDKLWEDAEIEEGEVFSVQADLTQIKAAGDILREKAEIAEANLLLINEFAIVNGKHYWRGVELEEMAEKAKKWEVLEGLMGEMGTKVFLEAMKKTKKENKE